MAQGGRGHACRLLLSITIASARVQRSRFGVSGPVVRGAGIGALPSARHSGQVSGRSYPRPYTVRGDATEYRGTRRSYGGSFSSAALTTETANQSYPFSSMRQSNKRSGVPGPSSTDGTRAELSSAGVERLRLSRRPDLGTYAEAKAEPRTTGAVESPSSSFTLIRASACSASWFPSLSAEHPRQRRNRVLRRHPQLSGRPAPRSCPTRGARRPGGGDRHPNPHRSRQHGHLRARCATTSP
jgi:hypothetical protein